MSTRSWFVILCAMLGAFILTSCSATPETVAATTTGVAAGLGAIYNAVKPALSPEAQAQVAQGVQHTTNIMDMFTNVLHGLSETIVAGSQKVQGLEHQVADQAMTLAKQGAELATKTDMNDVVIGSGAGAAVGHTTSRIHSRITHSTRA